MKHILNSAKINGTIELEYLNGQLSAIKFNLNAPLTPKQYECFIKCLPHYESEVERFKKLNFDISTPLEPNQKLALFCQLYEMYTGVKYKVNGADAGKIKHLDINRDLLLHYFTSQNFLFKGKHAIGNLARYYNELRAEIAGATKSKFPDVWSEAYENKLATNQERSAFWAHLRSLGLHPKKDRTGRTLEWVKI